MSATARRRVFSSEILDERPGTVLLKVSGAGTESAFMYESGGHRWQRVPPTEKRGRRHTSTVTVAVMPVFEEAARTWPNDEIQWWATRGTGSGGQAKNKTSNAVHMKHVPTGIQVRVETSRSQWENRVLAKELLWSKLVEWSLLRLEGEQRDDRRKKVGSGQRGDKIRTIRMQDDRVTDHRTGKTMAASKYLRGEIKELVA